jgi:acyl transferase domain-containing protein
MPIIGPDDDTQEAIHKWLARQKLPNLVGWWIRGLKFDWGRLYGDVKPQRISLPTYPFAKNRCWIDEAPGRGLDNHIEVCGNMKSIEDIINRICDDTMKTDQAIKLLRVLV